MKIYSRSIWHTDRPEDLGKESCPFCSPENAEYIMFQTDYWLLVQNKFPILGLKQHIMAVPKRHVILSKDLSHEELSDYGNILWYVHDYFWDQDFFSFLRESREARSLEHLHYHFLPGQMRYKSLEKMLEKQGFTNQLDSE